MPPNNELAKVVARIAEGFEARLALAKARASPTRSPVQLQTNINVTRSLLSAKHLVATDSSQTEKNRGLLISAATSSPSLGAQIRLLSAVSPPDDHSFNMICAIGAAFSGPEVTITNINSTSSVDSSIIAESVARFKPDELESTFPEILHPVIDASGYFWRNIGRLLPQPPSDDLTELWQRLGRLVEPNRPNSLEGLRQSVGGAKRKSLSILGPDLFSFVQAFLDPEIRLTNRQLESGHHLFRDAHLLSLFAKLLIARQLGEYESEKAYLKEHFDDLFKGLVPRTQFQMMKTFYKGGKPKPIRPSSNGWLRRLFYIICRLENSQQAFSPRLLTDAVIDLYELDPLLVEFLDWNRVSTVLASAPPIASARTAFLTHLMSSPSVRSRFPFVYLSMGMGAFIGDLSALVQDRPKADPMLTLMQRIRDLPPRSANRLAETIVERNVIERLVSSVPRTSRWPKELPPINESKLSISRLNALRYASARKLIPDDVLNQKFDQEIDRIRMEYFESRRRTGRVRVAWPDLAKGTRAFTEVDKPVLTALSLSSTTNAAQSSIVRQLAHLLSSRVSEYVLFKSEASVDQAISNNLRHGILLPRFLRAFDDAYQTTTRRNDLPSWDGPALERIFGADAADLIALRDTVSDRIKHFLDSDLTFEEGGAFAASVEDAMYDRILKHFAPNAGRQPALELSLSREAQRLTRAFLATASRALGDQVRKFVNAHLKTLRKRVRRTGASDTIAFVDCLETNLQAAFTEARQWIGLTVEKSDSIPFKVSEVVHLHLISTALFSSDKLRVTVSVRREGANSDVVPEPQIQGRYLELFEALAHNLISNAMKYSGESLKTRVDFIVQLGVRSVSVKCTNSIAPNKLEEICNKHPATVAQSKRRDADLARRDHASGFQKIRIVAERATGRQPRFAVPFPSRREHRYTVEVVIPTDESVENRKN